MALVSCPDCRREMSDQAPACPGCGRPHDHRPASAQKAGKRSTPAETLLILVVLTVGGAALYYFLGR